jgi:hypothetical protein
MVSIVTGTNGDLYWNGFYTDHWGGWQPLSGGSPSPPGLCQSGPGRVELVVEGYDENIYHKSFINGAWSATWDKVPTGATDTQPACAVLGTAMFMVVRGTDTNLYANSLDLKTGTWSPWVPLGGSTPSSPALAASSSINALDLVVRGTDNGVYHKFYANGAWSAWECAPTFACGQPIVHTVAAPVIVSGNANGTKLVQVAILTPNWTGAGASTFVSSMLEYAGSSWNTLPRYQIGSWQIVADSQNAPALAVDSAPGGGPPGSAGTVYLVTRGLYDSAIYLNYRYFDLGSGWTSGFYGGGNIGARPAAAMIGLEKVGVVAIGSTSDLWYNNWTCCGTWAGWTATGGSSSIDPGLITVP